LVERCEKCGKAFMDKSEVKRHKMYEHIVSVSPFEEQENKEKDDTIYENVRIETRKETNDSNNPEELTRLKMTTTTRTTIDINNTNETANSNNNKTSNCNNNNKRTSDIITGNRTRGNLRPFRL
jgi:hypothetical protein